MGLLADVFSWSDKQKRRIRGLLDNPEDEARVFAHRSAETTRDFLLDPMNFVGGGLGKIAWHGSPHKFDKFSMDKIGTGEGAQAYGHGMYLAEAPEVAKQYADRLSSVTIDGKPFTTSDPNISRTMRLIARDPDGARRFFNKEILPVAGADQIAEWKAAFSLAEQSKLGLIKDSSLYKTDIPDEAVSRFLDWDKPLSQQAPEVQKALKKSDFYKNARARYKGTKQWYDDPAQKTGEGLLKYLRSGTSDVAGGQSQYGMAEDYLRQQGIPGIRYLDGGSRGAGQGSSNFVVFDPDMIRILERNGQPTGLSPWAPGEWPGLLK